jgi:glycosyltransferase involved in cell wall biosynthesis
MNPGTPTRVLHVLEATLGGTRRYVEDLAGASNDASYVNAIAYGTARADAAFYTLLDEMHASGWQSFDIDLRRRVDVGHDFRSVMKLREVIATFRPDIIHGHSSKGGAIARLAVIGNRRRPSIVYSPNAVAVDLGLQYSIAEHLLAPFTDVFAAISASERRELMDLRLGSATSVQVVSPTIRSEYFAPRDRASARVELGLGNEPLVIGIGRLAPQKDPLGFVETIVATREFVPDLQAIWIGDGELRGAMEAAIASAGLQDAVRITGWLTDVRPYIAACDVFLSSAAYESFGYVTAEALAMGRPVVASSINGTIDIVTTDIDRALFSPRDFSAAARAIAAFIREPAMAAAVAARGRQRILEAFSPETTRRHLAEAYANLSPRTAPVLVATPLDTPVA